MRVGTRNGVSRADSLTGVLTINLLCDDDSKPSVNQFDIYNRYNKIFPNLTLQYGNNITGVQAHRIEFYRTDIDNMTNDVTPDYVVLTDGAKSLATLTGNNSPAGEPLFIPSKAETNTHKYEFSGYWVVYAPDDMTIHKTKYSVADFETIIPTRDLKFTPEFTK